MVFEEDDLLDLLCLPLPGDYVSKSKDPIGGCCNLVNSKVNKSKNLIYNCFSNSLNIKKSCDCAMSNHVAQ